MLCLKRKWRVLVNRFRFFAMIESFRQRNKYDVVVINEGIKKTRTIHFIHRCNTPNTGDVECGYYRHFMNLFANYRCLVHDISSVKFKLIKENDCVIIGGGGLLNALSEWNYNINKAIKKAGKSVIWSAGFNSNELSKFSELIMFDKVDLVSIRDFGYSDDFRYVPCATCMMPLFDKEYESVRDIGVVIHHRKKNIPVELKGFDSIENIAPINDFIEFIGQSSVIITNSYHAAYWSALMKKRCVVFDQESSVKFKYLKYQPSIYDGNMEESIKRTVIFQEALEESRFLVKEYIEDILRLLEN